MKKYVGYVNTNAATDKDPGNSGTLTATLFSTYTLPASIDAVLDTD